MTIARQGAFHTGRYRNVLAEYGYGEAEIRRRLDDVWHALFHGDEDVRIYYPHGDDMGYLLDTGNLDVRTEGLSYGMMMAVQMDRQEEFNRIWLFAKTFMQHREGRYKHYFAWHTKPDGTRISEGPAPDGEEYFAMALFFASAGTGRGSYSVERIFASQAAATAGSRRMTGTPAKVIATGHMIPFSPWFQR